MMKKGGVGGASTLTGQTFEAESDLLAFLKGTDGYKLVTRKGIVGTTVFFRDRLVARSFKKHKLYEFLNENNVNWEQRISSRLLPDEAILVGQKLFIVEVKRQSGGGSVDEKLQTCDFKRKQYLKLVEGLRLGVEYVYFLNDWFTKPKYKDVLNYIESVGCHYEFDMRRLMTRLGLPSADG